MLDLQPGVARFDEALRAWILTRYADVSAALREPRLLPFCADAGAHEAHLAVREAGREALSLAQLDSWRAGMEREARARVGMLPEGRAVDLVRELVAPWSLALAVAATGASAGDAPRLVRLAREVFLAAACATDLAPEPRASAAAAELARSLAGTGEPLAVQAFVALSQTLPCFLASAWLALLRHPAEAARLRARPDLVREAVEELLRFASPARAVFRRAVAEVSIGRVRIGSGERAILALSAANHDPARFQDPERLDLQRRGSGHLAFGGGSHFCVGAPLIRSAAAIATQALLAATAALEPCGEPEWIGGFAIRGPGSLPVTLRRAASASAPG